MSFEKGQSGNPNGRPKGAKDKATAELRERVKMILDEHFTPEVITEDLASMEPKDRLTFLTKLMEYAIPRLKQTDATVTELNKRDETPVFVFTNFAEKNNRVAGG